MPSLKKFLVLFLSILLILSDFHQEVSGLRILEGEQWLKQRTDLIIQSLPRGPVPSSGANPCTNIPGGKRRGRCALAKNIKEEKIIASQVDDIHTAPSSAYPSNMVQFGSANSENNDTQKQG
ncbi:hypothetical protein P3S67_026309 [Capsicum chacoense]|uniref:Uncharacterized protein n=1 Tax=Capsicum annuum TaxID=4072 RepID=A0A2G2Y6J4_CAPAN|nr:hypothetical protein FXO37_20162 [Capsicum annuum]KAF3681911.1 hypothetical protein FXO38_01521 [Capsicum annuum]PHT65385.1 hypothetical protein T459_29810 [Capsicum annuum]